MEKYNKNQAWFDKKKEQQEQKVRIRIACHNWLRSQVMEIIEKKKQAAPPEAIARLITENYYQ